MNKDTNAIHWLQQYVRSPYPQKMIWDLATTAPREQNIASSLLKGSSEILAQPRQVFYWLDLSGNKNPSGLIEASYCPENNRLSLNLPDSLTQIRVLLRQGMVDFNQPITVSVNGTALGTAQAQGDLRVMTRTLLERGDSQYIFHDDLVLRRETDGTWSLEAE
jgi:hypothetical protein